MPSGIKQKSAVHFGGVAMSIEFSEDGPTAFIAILIVFGGCTELMLDEVRVKSDVDGKLW